MHKIFIENKEYKNLYITILSFGFKYGLPSDADLVFDVRFLPNPYYIDDLRAKSGNDPEVRDYVMDNEKAVIFLDKLTDMVRFLIPNYVQEGKTQLVIAVGCTGGETSVCHPCQCALSSACGRRKRLRYKNRAPRY